MKDEYDFSKGIRMGVIPTINTYAVIKKAWDLLMGDEMDSHKEHVKRTLQHYRKYYGHLNIINDLTKEKKTMSMYTYKATVLVPSTTDLSKNDLFSLTTPYYDDHGLELINGDIYLVVQGQAKNDDGVPYEPRTIYFRVVDDGVEFDHSDLAYIGSLMFQNALRHVFRIT